MFTVRTQYSITGKRGGYTLQWMGDNKPTYIVGPKSTCCWYKHKTDALKACQTRNDAIQKRNDIQAFPVEI